MPTIDTKDFAQGKEAADAPLTAPAGTDYRVSPGTTKYDASRDYRVLPGSGQKSLYRDPLAEDLGKSETEKFLGTSQPMNPSLPEAGAVEVPVGDSETEKFLMGDDSRLALSFEHGVKKTADQASRILQLQARTGLPEDLIERNMELVEFESKKAGFDPVAFRQSSPIVAQWMAENPNHSAVANDDLNQLTYLERQFRYISDQKRRGDLTVELSQIGTDALFGRATPEQRTRQTEIEKDLATQSDYDITGFIEQVPGAVANQLPIWKRTVKSGLTGAGAGAVAIGGAAAVGGAAATGGPGALPAGAAGAATGAVRGWMIGAGLEAARMEAGIAYSDFEKIKDQDGVPLDRASAVGAALIVGAANGALEMVGLQTILKNAPGLRNLTRSGVKQILKSPTARGAFMTYAKGIGEAVLAEGVTEFSQELVTKTMGGLLQAFQNGNLDNLSTGAVLETMSEAVQAGRAGMQAGGGMSAVTSAPSVAMDLRRARQAEANAQVFQAIGEGLQSTKMYENLPTKTQELIARMTQDGPAENVYVPVEAWNEYWQSKQVDPGEVAQEILGNTESYDEAVRTGGDIQIPTARYATTLAPTEHNAFFSTEMRANPTDMNAREAQEFMQQMDAQEEERLKAEVPPEEQVAQVIRERVTTQLTEAGFDEATASTYSQLYEKAFQTLGKRAGIDPVALFEKFGLKIARPEDQATEDETALEQAPLSPLGFFSQVEKQVQDMDFKEMPAKDLANRIANLQGVKKEELEEIGLHEWLETRASTDPFLVRTEYENIVTNNRFATREEAEAYASNNSDRGAVTTITETSIGRVTKEEVLEFIRNNGVKVEQVVLSENFAGRRNDGTPDIADLRWDQPELLEPDSDMIDSEFEYYAFEDDFIREEKFADSWNAFLSSKDTSKEDFESLSYSDKRKLQREWVNNDRQVEQWAISQAEESLASEDSPYARFKVREQETGWTLYGSDEYGWYNEDTRTNYENANLSEAKVLATREMLEQGLVAGSDQQLIRSEDLSWGHPRGEKPSQKTIDKKAKELIKKNPGKYRERAKAGLGEDEIADEKKMAKWDLHEAVIDVEESYDDPKNKKNKITIQIDHPILSGNITGNDVKGYTLSVSKEIGEKTRSVFESKLSSKSIEAAKAEAKNLMQEKGIFAKRQAQQNGDVNEPTGRAQYESYTVDGGENYREVLLTLPNITPGFHDGHFSQRNVLAHVRLTDRESADGKKVLFVEELQSDWHQKGREQGYRSEEGGEVADAPFKQTDAWAALAMKRIIRLAVEQGYDAVAWAPAEVHVDRWGTDSISWVRVPALKEDVKNLEVKQLGSMRFKIGFKDGGNLGNSPDFFSAEEAQKYLEARQSDGWFVGSVEQVGGRAGGVDIEGEARRRGKLLEENGTVVTTKEELQKVISRSLGRERRERSLESLTEQVWKQMQDKESGVKAPRKEGFEFFYDNLLPKKVMPKILKTLDKEAKVTVDNVSARVNDGEIQAWFVPLTPEIKKKAMEGISLFQPGEGDGPRGRIRFSGSRQEFNIDLLKEADLSTFLHETGHFYLEVLKELASGADATPEIQADFQTALNWLGVAEGEQITREAHEKWARGFEAYLMEGKAPTPELRTAFARFRAWLISIYQELVALNVELTDEVRGVFDRLLATETEIAQAEQQQNFQPVFPDPEAVGMTPEQARDYEQAIMEAREQSREELNQKLLAEEARQRKIWWKAERDAIRDQVEEEVNQEKVYFALSVLQRGKMPDGTDLPDGLPKGMKLDRDALYKAFPKELVKKLPKPYVYAAEGGFHHDEVAMMFGFGSGTEMIVQMAAAENKDALVDRLTDERMKELHGDLLTDGKLPIEAMKAIHSEKRSQLLRRELEILATQDLSKLKGIIRKVTRRIPTIGMVRAQAEAAIARKKVRDINPFLYQRAEAKAAKEAVEAVLKGDFDAAFEAKQRELLNHEYYRAATAAREEVDSVVEYMGRFNRPNVRQRIGRAGHDYLDQIDAILERFDFRKGISLKALDRRASLLKWVQNQQALGLTIEVPDSLLNEANRQHYKDTPLEELRGIRDTVKNIEHLAKLKNELLASDRKRDLEAARDEIVASIAAHHNIEQEPVDLAPSISKVLKDKVLSGIAAHTKMEFLFELLDGNKRGPVWEYLFRPFAKAEDAENTMLQQSVEAMTKIFEVYPRKERSFWFLNKVFIQEAKNEKINGSFTKANMIAVALNWGNAYNREALMRGYGWNEAQVQAILNQLDERDWNVVQSIWDYIDSYWPQIAAMEQKLNGIVPQKVEATSFETRFGKMRGGYYPIVFDQKQSFRQHQLDSAANVKEMFGGNWAKAMTRHGHTKERNDTGGKPILLELTGLTQHLTNVIHDLTHREAIIDVAKIIGQKEVREAIEAAVGKEMYRQLNPWLTAIASDRRGEYANPMEGILGRARMGATIVNMGWKFTTALVQFTGYTVTVKEIGTKYAAKGLHEAFGKPWELTKNWDFITERSTMMANRLTSYDRDIRDAFKRLNVAGTKPGALSAVDSYTGGLKDSWFVMIGYMDLAVSMPTWFGAYHKAMDGFVDGIEKGDESAAIEFADKTVRTSQGAGAAKDLALVQRGNEAFRLFTMFYSYFSVLFNQFKKTHDQFRMDHNAPKLLASLVLIWFVPAVLEDLMLGRGPDDGADDEEWMRWALGKTMSYPFQSIVLMRDVINGMGQYGYSPSAAFDAFENFSKTASIVRDKITGDKEELERKDYKSLTMTAGYVAGLPTRQVWLSGEYFYDWLVTGEEDPETPIEGLWRGVVTGKPKR